MHRPSDLDVLVPSRDRPAAPAGPPATVADRGAERHDYVLEPS
ncbi:hypothetical protein [Nonomuraea sp. NPDC050202]